MKKRTQSKPRDLPITRLIDRRDDDDDVHERIATGEGYDDEEPGFLDGDIDDEPHPEHAPHITTEDLVRMMPAGTRIRRLL